MHRTLASGAFTFLDRRRRALHPQRHLRPRRTPGDLPRPDLGVRALLRAPRPRRPGATARRHAMWSSTSDWTASTLPPRSTSPAAGASRRWWHRPSTTPGSDSASPGPVPRSGRGWNRRPRRGTAARCLPTRGGPQRRADPRRAGATSRRAWQGRLRPGPRLAVRCEPPRPRPHPAFAPAPRGPGPASVRRVAVPYSGGSTEGLALPARSMREQWKSGNTCVFCGAGGTSSSSGPWPPPSSASPPRPAPEAVRSPTRPPTPCSRTPTR